MKNLEQLGLVALDATELQEVQGGGKIWDFVKGLAKEAVKIIIPVVITAAVNKALD